MIIDKAIKEGLQHEEKRIDLSTFEYEQLLKAINEKIDTKEAAHMRGLKGAIAKLKKNILIKDLSAVAAFILILITVPILSSNYINKNLFFIPTKNHSGDNIKNNNLYETTLVSYKYKKRFVDKELKLLKDPKENSNSINLILSNSVINIYGAVKDSNNTIWLNAEIPVYDSPVNNFGWIKESDTTNYSKDKLTLVQSDVYINKNTPIFETFDFESISSTPSYNTQDKIRGRLIKRQQGYALLSCPGGMNIWVDEKYLIFPKLEEDNYHLPLPLTVIENYYNSLNKKNKEKLLNTLTERYKTLSADFEFGNLKNIKPINIEIDLDTNIKSGYISNGPGSLNDAKEENVICYKVIYEVKHQNIFKASEENGIHTIYFTLVRKDESSPWLIDEIGQP